ncbi:hypothetical protein P7K49_014243 [Saguinus oedipus]|uniref:Small ribosomal subunit protein uS8 n=1 Tax=Saguinus oedipus TaxID=9490 RepID=A0ABQ9VI93_SAGOE|nr:hypothetical protein P7K49_014243 [Saguinus oedipus]
MLQSHVRFLTVMMKHGYIGEFEITDDHRAGKIVVNLTGRLNKCGVISPRLDVQLKDLEKRQNHWLPSHQFGFIVLTTSAGIMDHEEARRKRTRGKILGFLFLGIEFLEHVWFLYYSGLTGSSKHPNRSCQAESPAGEWQQKVKNLPNPPKHRTPGWAREVPNLQSTEPGRFLCTAILFAHGKKEVKRNSKSPCHNLNAVANKS